MRRRSLIAGSVMVALTWWPAGGAWGTPSDDAELLVRQGIALRMKEEDAAALSKFQEAYRITSTPRIEAQIAAAEQALGRWLDAETHFTAALAAESNPWIVKNRPTLEKALGSVQSHIGSLEILGEPSGAEVHVDGRLVGHLPKAGPLRHPAGVFRIEVRASGFAAATRTVSVEAGKTTRETIVLNVLAEPTTEAVAVAPPVARAPEHREPRNEQREAPQATRSVVWRLPLAWGTAGGAAVGVGVGIAGLVIRNGKARDYNRLADMGGCAGAGTSMCASLRSSGDDAGTAAIIGFSAAGAMAVTSTLLFLWTPEVPASVTAVLGACTSDWTIRGITCGTSF